MLANPGKTKPEGWDVKMLYSLKNNYVPFLLSRTGRAN
jgi:hypothetical protein